LDPGKKIKVCHLTSVHRSTDTRIYWKECLALSKDYDVYLLAPSAKDFKSDPVHIIPLKTPSNRIIRFLVTDFVLFYKAVVLDADLYHFHDPELIPVGLFLKLVGKKVIYDIHEDVSADFKEKTWLPFKNLSGKIYQWFEGLAVRHFYLVLAEKSYAKKYENKDAKFVIVQNFTQTDFANAVDYKYNSSENVIALVGMLSARRGLPFILDALLILKERGMIIKLRCIGEVNKGVQNILANSSSYHVIKDQVEFCGYIPFPESSLAITDCLAGMALPETLPNHKESFPTKMFEYMAVGLPVICSDFPLYKEVVEKYGCGLAVTPENPVAIADSIAFLIKNKETAAKMSANAKAAIKNFDWETEAEKLLNFYKQILN
jgi:glycosyltransferase involved in cell wall biosynthesis